VRLAVYTDYVYCETSDALFAERAFALFLVRIAELVDELVLLGRLSPDPGRAHYRLPPGVKFVALPNHPGLLVSPQSTVAAILGSIGPVWDLLPRVDALWLLGPHPLVPVFGALATLRRRPFAIGVRQDTPRYVRERHPGARAAWLAADALEGLNLAMALRAPTVVVGPDLARRYRRARRLLSIVVSLVRDDDIVSLEKALARQYSGDLRALSVGRLETEKNPLLLADISATLSRARSRWRLDVCGDGPLRSSLAQRLVALGAADAVRLLGYVPIGPELFERYRTAHALLHISWTEGVPQVLYEAFAAGLPVVATDVGGVAEAVGDAALLIPAGNAEAAAQALQQIGDDKELRDRLIERGLSLVRRHTLDVEAGRTATFIKRELGFSPVLPTRSSAR
jgi:glycosyltransferase involved in cell wall biosynthesis